MTEEEYIRNRLDMINRNSVYGLIIDTEITKLVRDHMKELEENKMEPTSVWKIENIDNIWFTQDGDGMSLMLKNKDDLTKITLSGDAIDNYNDTFVISLKTDIDDLEQEREALLEENDKLRYAFDDLSEENKKLRKRIDTLKGRKKSTSTDDMVNHPSHYETGKFECIEVMQEIFGVDAVRDFCKCNAFKYVYRMDRKNGTEDVKKAIWYLNKYLELTEKEE